MKLKQYAAAAAMLAAFAAPAQSQFNRPAGTAPTPGTGYYATDTFPGFDDLDTFPRYEKKETSWFNGVKADTDEGQWLYIEEMLSGGARRAARRGCVALIAKWPAGNLAPKAQLELSRIYEELYEDYDRAFDELDYLVEFYPWACTEKGVGAYADLVAHMYALVDKMVETKKTFLGFSFTSDKETRRKYEIVVRRAPGADYVPEALIKIGALRESEKEYEEAVAVYESLIQKYPNSPLVLKAVYRDAVSRMWLVRRLAYNRPRCEDTRSFLRDVVRRYPDLPETEEVRAWLGELETYLSRDAFERAKFYDSRTRTKHAALASWRNFVEQYPESAYVDEAKARIMELESNSPEQVQ